MAFIDNSNQANNEIERKTLAFLEEVKASISSQAARNTKRNTGRLAESWTTDSEVIKSTHTARIGSTVDYSIYYEFGTGEYALKGNGRTGGWVYRDIKTGKYYFTYGQTPKRPLYRAFQQKQANLKSRAREVMKLD